MGELEDKVKALREIESKIKECKKCPLWRGRNNAVPGEGNPNAVIMFIGEAPGRQEDLEGRPFVGAAGRLLTELLFKIGFRREDVYITNVVKCRPPGNRDPKEEEIAVCSPYLDQQIRIIKPKVIVTLGRHSTLYILKKSGKRVRGGIMSLRGRFYRVNLEGKDIIVFPTLHPAAALYNPRLKDILQNDFFTIREVYQRTVGEKKGLDAFL